ncbi:MAG: class II fumarate hydratase [Opitutaceae bacterium]
MNSNIRVETDSMGKINVPASALYGASTQRAVDNFPISGRSLPPRFITTLGLVKRACAEANAELGRLEPALAESIAAAAAEIAEGRLLEHFPLDVFQTGSGTSTNMNANEVIANRCSQIAGQPLGSKRPVHPNDHANCGQSSNDVIPTTLHVSAALSLREDLLPALQGLRTALGEKATQWSDTIKLGRTHLMDATPITLGQEFSGYERQIAKAIERVHRSIAALGELAIGGTAVGTGLNTDAAFGAAVCRILSSHTGIAFREAENHFEAQGGRDDAVEVAGQLCAIAAALTKVANDIRLLGTGPRAGLGELQLPPTQPGSSIMPGKVNPVMSEMLVQTCHYAVGLCQTVTRCGQDGHLELNATLPLIAHCLLTSIRCLANASRTFATHCVEGLGADFKRCFDYAHNALGLATLLNPHIGYDHAAKVAKTAHTDGISIKAAALKLGFLDDASLDEILWGENNR